MKTTVAVPAVEWMDGSTTPEGEATFRDPKSLSKRQKRLLEGSFMALAGSLPKFESLAKEQAEKEQADSGAVDPGIDRPAVVPELTEQEISGAWNLQDASIVAHLESWTIGRPLPTLADVGDLPEDLYDALEAAASKLAMAKSPTFDPSPSTDPEDPTGA